jgi:decaprenylphospho-beta-D-ribofuranose 2-oxidase
MGDMHPAPTSTKRELTNWGHSARSRCDVTRVASVAELRTALAATLQAGASVSLMGSGLSYSDCFFNEGQTVLDISALDEILGWDRENGILHVEGGVTFLSALHRTLLDKWVLPVVPGARHVTLGGALGSNVHGKNCFRRGNFSSCVLSAKVLLASGDAVECSAEQNADLFHALPGSQGCLGIILEMRLQLEKVPSAFLEVTTHSCPDWTAMDALFAQAQTDSDYVIGQVDAFAPAAQFGRGTVHTASFVQSDRPTAFAGNGWASRLVSSLPKSAWKAAAWDPFFSAALGGVSRAKYRIERGKSGQKQLVDFINFNFLLDKTPRFKYSFPGGLVEMEPLVDRPTAGWLTREAIPALRRRGVRPFLIGVKLHRKDAHPLSYSGDGYSFGIDFPGKYLVDRSRQDLLAFHSEIAARGGTFYLAKDQLLSAQDFLKAYPGAPGFLQVKKKYDPWNLFQSNLYRRLLQPETPRAH